MRARVCSARSWFIPRIIQAGRFLSASHAADFVDVADAAAASATAAAAAEIAAASATTAAAVAVAIAVAAGAGATRLLCQGAARTCELRRLQIPEIQGARRTLLALETLLPSSVPL